MSTRCQIEFKHITKYKNSKEPVIERRTVYRHSDGYPEGESGVFATLKQFLLWNKGRNNDIEYQTANFIYWSKRWCEELYFNETKEGKKWNSNQPTNCSILHVGFGVCENDGFHGDIEFFYEVVLTEEKECKIICYKVDQKNFSKPIKREDLKVKEEILLKQEEF